MSHGIAKLILREISNNILWDIFFFQNSSLYFTAIYHPLELTDYIDIFEWAIFSCAGGGGGWTRCGFKERRTGRTPPSPKKKIKIDRKT